MYNNAELFIVQKYGEDSFQHKMFQRISFREINVEDITGHSSMRAYRNGLEEAKRLLKNFRENILEEEIKMADDKQVNVLSKQLNFQKVFIVHGHDGELKEAVARVIEKQGITAIILSEQANRGKTIFEKFEYSSDVGGAICLFTQDDIGKAKTEDKDKFRARQNVVFEAGYFMGKLGRERTVMIKEDGVELPSDLQGMVYTNKENWKLELVKELDSMGYKIDLKKLP